MIDVQKIRQDFPILERDPLVYFDNAATTFKPRPVIDRIIQYYEQESVNIHRGDYPLSFKVSQAYDDVRKKVARFLNVQSKEIVFTSGASEALNLVAIGYGMTHLKEGDVILTTEAEHASNILPWFNVARKTGAKIDYIDMSDQGVLNLEDYRKKLNDSVKVVLIAHVSNVLGYMNPIEEMTQLAHDHGAVFVCDGAQAVAHMPVDLQKLGVDFYGFSGHKMCGPTGVGVLYGRYDLLDQMEPLLYGGGSNARFNYCGNVLLKNPPEKFESGTPNISGVLGLGAAIDYLESIGMDQICAYEQELHHYLMTRLKKLDHIIIYNPEGQLGITTFNVKGIFPQDVAAYLGSQNICVRAGNHCAKILLEVLKTNETCRASLYFYNTKEEVDAFIGALETITLEKTIDLFL